MTRQLTLLESPPAWRIDEPTREAGRRGVADARAALRAALAARADGDQPAGEQRPAHNPAA
jgi:hypothetical protein